MSDIHDKMSDMAGNRITIRIPNALSQRLREHSKIKGQGESELVREALESYLGRASKLATAHEVARISGLVGCVQGMPRDLSTNPKHMQGFGKRK